jgi:hypothetical protein
MAPNSTLFIVLKSLEIPLSILFGCLCLVGAWKGFAFFVRSLKYIHNHRAAYYDATRTFYYSRFKPFFVFLLFVLRDLLEYFFICLLWYATAMLVAYNIPPEYKPPIVFLCFAIFLSFVRKLFTAWLGGDFMPTVENTYNGMDHGGYGKKYITCNYPAWNERLRYKFNIITFYLVPRLCNMLANILLVSCTTVLSVLLKVSAIFMLQFFATMLALYVSQKVGLEKIFSFLH